MSYELSIPLKRGSLEIEFDTMAELERKLAKLDVPRLERAIAAALSGATSKAPTKKAAKRPAKKAAKKRAKRTSN